jgi:UDP-N-acetylmuramyl tripeptide synthase
MTVYGSSTAAYGMTSKEQSKLEIILTNGKAGMTVNCVAIPCRKPYMSANLLYIPLRTVLEAMGADVEYAADKTITALSKFECGFGRMETISTQGKNIKVILVKNPTGFNQVISYLLSEEKEAQIAFLINDKLADGTDISWLWDVEFEKLEDMQEKVINVYTSGIRAEDMAVRLKYAGIYTYKISIIKDYKELIAKGLAATPEGHNFYILPTYTAMLAIRRILKSKFGLKEFWK